jgi:hypothetical protein
MGCFHHDLARDWVALTCRIFYLSVKGFLAQFHIHSLSKLAIQITQDSPAFQLEKTCGFGAVGHSLHLTPVY